MDLHHTILQFDLAVQIAIFGLLLTSLGWLVSMLFTLFSRKAAKPGFRRAEIAVIAFSLLTVGSLWHVGRALATPPPEEAREIAPTSTGGTGTCASVRIGASVSQVNATLGTPSMERSTEDALGPGASVMIFDDSRCVVHLLNGKVSQIE